MSKIDKAMELQSNKKFAQAEVLWREIRTEYPLQSTGYIHGGIALRHLKKISRSPSFI